MKTEFETLKNSGYNYAMAWRKYKYTDMVKKTNRIQALARIGTLWDSRIDYHLPNIWYSK
jgi:hypothetical protein